MGDGAIVGVTVHSDECFDNGCVCGLDTYDDVRLLRDSIDEGADVNNTWEQMSDIDRKHCADAGRYPPALFEDADPIKEQRERGEDMLFEEVATSCDIDWRQLTSSARGALNRATAELRSLGVHPSEVRRRADEFRRRYPRATLTPTALAKHWPALQVGETRPSTAPTLGRGVDAKPLWVLDDEGIAHRA